VLDVVRLPLGGLATNCYLVARQGAPETVVVDPGAEPDRILAELAARGRQAAALLLTHAHTDHVGGVAAVAHATGAEVWMPRGEADRLRGYPGAPYEPEHLLDGGEAVTAAGIEFATYPVPGHSPASIAYHADGVLLSGDVLFAGSIGRADLEGGDLDTLLASIARLLRELPPETVVLPGHGPDTTLGREHATNPYLQGLGA